MTKRNSYLDVAKFLFSLIVVVYHFDMCLPGGYLVVEAFFMISGYFMMKSLERDSATDKLGVATCKFVLHKYKAIVFFLIPSAIIGCIAYVYIIPRDTESVLMQATLMLFEMIPMQTAGYTGFFATGVSWYLSAMFFAFWMIYPLARRFRSDFTLGFCPLIAILTYGCLAVNFGYLGAPNSLINHLINSGILRAVAGICAGCFLYECATRTEHKPMPLVGKILCTLLEIVGWAYCLYVMSEYPESMYDAAVVFVMFGLLLIGINRYSLLSPLIQFKWTRHLATASTLIYLNHFYWNRFIRDYLINPLRNPNAAYWTRSKQIFLYFGLICASSVTVYLIGTLVTRLLKRRREKAEVAAA